MARSIARQAAMQLLYERLSGGEADSESLELVYEQLSKLNEEEGELHPSKSELAYIKDVLEGWTLPSRSIPPAPGRWSVCLTLT